MTMGTLGPPARRAAPRGVARAVGLAAACTLGGIGGVGRRGPARGAWGRVMSSDLGQFLEACGANGPVRREWDDWETGKPVARDFERPAVPVGRNPHADLVLGHPLVGQRHAYLQLVEGRLFAIDLGSREGLRWGGVARRGAVDRPQPAGAG